MRECSQLDPNEMQENKLPHSLWWHNTFLPMRNLKLPNVHKIIYFFLSGYFCFYTHMTLRSLRIRDLRFQGCIYPHSVKRAAVCQLIQCLMPPLHQDTSELGVVSCGKEIWTWPHGTTRGNMPHGDSYSFLAFTPKSDAVWDTSKK